jgi:AraC-like DNA-binding protein
LPVIDADQQVIGLIGEVAIAHEYVRARVAEQMEMSTSGMHSLPPRNPV